jgi:CheY-like chemotaxis protein
VGSFEVGGARSRLIVRTWRASCAFVLATILSSGGGCCGSVVATIARDGRGQQDVPVIPTVLIVDDHAPYRASARRMLEAEGFRVVGEAGDAAEALEAVARLRPAIVLLDIQLPGRDGFSVADHLASFEGSPAVVLISSRPAEAFGPRLAAAPVRGFINKADLTGSALAELVA